MEKIVIVKWTVKDSEALRILELLPELAEKTRSEQGNISYAIYQAENDPREFILHEHYADPAAADFHRQSEHYKRIVVKEIMPHLEVREVMSVKRLL